MTQRSSSSFISYTHFFWVYFHETSLKNKQLQQWWSCWIKPKLIKDIPAFWGCNYLVVVRWGVISLYYGCGCSNQMAIVLCQIIASLCSRLRYWDPYLPDTLSVYTHARLHCHTFTLNISFFLFPPPHPARGLGKAAFFLRNNAPSFYSENFWEDA